MEKIIFSGRIVNIDGDRLASGRARGDAKTHGYGQYPVTEPREQGKVIYKIEGRRGRWEEVVKNDKEISRGGPDRKTVAADRDS